MSHCSIAPSREKNDGVLTDCYIVGLHPTPRLPKKPDWDGHWYNTFHPKMRNNASPPWE